MDGVVRLADKLARIGDYWQPGIVACLNDYHVKVVKLKGEFTWHAHEQTDELFLVLQGRMTIHLGDGAVTLQEGELYVVPRGVEHKPEATEECHVLLLEPAGTVNTGDNPGDLTHARPEWL